MQEPGDFSVIFRDVTIGDGTRVGNFVMIRSNTLIGEGCTIGSYVDIEGDVVIGEPRLAAERLLHHARASSSRTRCSAARASSR